MNPNEIFTLRDAERQYGPTAFATMLKPVGSLCNLDCRYCYYLGKSDPAAGRPQQMDDALLETYIRQYIEANDAPVVSFCWHGGEPLLAGMEFYRKALRWQQRYAGGRRIDNSIQTNGTLLTEAWCDFLAENRFLVGISLDGPQDLHDAFRLDRGGQPTFERVMQAVERLRSRGVEFNTMSVVHRRSEGRGAEIYRFLRDRVQSRFMQFLPAVEYVVDRGEGMRPRIVPPGTAGARPAGWSLSARGYGDFLCDVFDEWVVRDVGTVFVQLFDATLAQWCGVQSGLCSMNETCDDALVVEHNGDVYPCDHFVFPEYCLGNLHRTPLRELYRSPARWAFSRNKRNTLPAECLRCCYGFACRGGCPKHRFDKGSGGGGKNSLCEGLYRWFDHAAPCMERMRGLLADGRPAAWVMPWARRHLGLEK